MSERVTVKGHRRGGRLRFRLHRTGKHRPHIADRTNNKKQKNGPPRKQLGANDDKAGQQTVPIRQAGGSQSHTLTTLARSASLTFRRYGNGLVQSQQGRKAALNGINPLWFKAVCHFPSCLAKASVASAEAADRGPSSEKRGL